MGKIADRVELARKTKATPDMDQGFRIAGVHFGYPYCCIEYFIKCVTHGRKTNTVGPWYNTGFVPCNDCAKKANENWPDFVKLINGNKRECPHPFPWESGSQPGYVANVIWRVLQREA